MAVWHLAHTQGSAGEEGPGRSEKALGVSVSKVRPKDKRELARERCWAEERVEAKVSTLK